jgi:O-antigen/teichoic acid export membrane protein
VLQGIHLRNTLRRYTPRAFDGLWARLEASPIGERLLRGTFWSLAGTFVARVLALAAAVVAARILGKTVFGQLGIIQSTVGMLGTLAGFGMGTTASKFIAELRVKDPAKAGRMIALSSLASWCVSVLLAGILAVTAPWLCQHTLAAPQLTEYLRTSAPLLLLSGINGAQLGVLSGFEAFRAIARVSALAGILNFPLVVGGAAMFGLSGVIWGMVLAQAGGCLLNFVALRREARLRSIPIRYSQCLEEFDVVWRFSIPAVLAEILISAISWYAATMLVRQLNGYGEMGAFSAANQWFNAMLWLPFMLNGVTLPVLSERLAANDRANIIKLLKMTFMTNAAVIVPILTLGSIASPYIMASYGRGFREAWPTLIAVLVTATILSFELPIAQLITASGRMWLGFSSNVGWGIVFLGGTSLLLKWGWGSFGLATARLLAYSAHAIFSLAFAAIFITGARRAFRTTEGAVPAFSSAGGNDIAG